MKALSTIVLTLVLAMILSVIYMPPWALWARPEWVLLVLVYWVLAVPERCGMTLAAFVGLLQDSLTGSLLGSHVLSYALIIAVVMLSHQRLRMYDVWQQAGFVFILIGLQQLMVYWIGLATGQQKVGLWFLLPAFISALIWPWLMVVLRGIRRSVGMVKNI